MAAGAGIAAGAAGAGVAAAAGTTVGALVAEGTRVGVGLGSAGISTVPSRKVATPSNNLSNFQISPVAFAGT